MSYPPSISCHLPGRSPVPMTLQLISQEARTLPWHLSLLSDLRTWPWHLQPHPSISPAINRVKRRQQELRGRRGAAFGTEGWGRRGVHSMKEFCCPLGKSEEAGRSCIWIDNHTSLWEIREKPKHNGHIYSPGLVIVRRSSCRCCCKRKHTVKALIWAREWLVLSRSTGYIEINWCSLMILQRQRELAAFCLSLDGQS